jgi:branched-chain amino acid aminotransferase
MGMQEEVPHDAAIWIDGNFSLFHNATTHVLSHGLHYGTGVFEGIRVYQGKLFRPLEHFKRFIESGNLVKIKIKYTAEELVKITEDLVKRNNCQNGYVRPLAWLGAESLLIDGDNPVHTVIACWDRSRPFNRDISLNPQVKLTISFWVKPYPNSIPHSSKAAGFYIMNYIIKRDAKERGYDDAIVLDYQHNITEASTSNIFLVKDGELHTPKADYFLSGITRKTIIELAHKLHIKVIERDISSTELSSFHEAFLTGTACEILSIKSIKETNFQLGPVTKELAAAFYDMVMSL